MFPVRFLLSYACRTPNILGEGGENAQKDKEFLERTKRKEIQKGKEKKIRDKRFSKMISLNAKNLESVLLAEPHEVTFE